MPVKLITILGLPDARILPWELVQLSAVRFGNREPGHLLSIDSCFWALPFCKSLAGCLPS